MANVKAGIKVINDLIAVGEKENESVKGKLTCKQVGDCLDGCGLGEHKEKVLRSVAPPSPANDIVDAIEDISVGDVVSVITGLGGLFF